MILVRKQEYGKSRQNSKRSQKSPFIAKSIQPFCFKIHARQKEWKEIKNSWNGQEIPQIGNPNQEPCSNG